MKLTNQQYDILKLFAILILPISEFVSALASIWGLPYGAQIVATLVALDTLLGAVVKVASASDNYQKGKEDVGH